MKNKKKLEYVVERGIDWDLNSAKSFVPDWYKKASRTFDGEISLLKQNKTIKYCTPFLDALISGYMLETTCDIEVVRDGDYSIMNWVHTDQPEVIGNRNDSVLSTFERGSEYTLDNFFWGVHMGFKKPPGYSLLITHPLNRNDLPFSTLSGVIDADEGIHGGRMPFFLKKHFEGIIPAGTPYAQVIPFKRDNWKSEKNEKIKKILLMNSYKSATRLFGWYKKEIWKKKEYE